MMEGNLSTLTYESGAPEYDDFPHTLDPVYILGEAYSALHDREELKEDVRSRLWITYRKGFQNIGGLGPSSDNGWGCMLRCGQMMLAQALTLRHLGRGWRWKPGSHDNDYRKLLCMFEDKKSAIYSIHQIASMGESEGKAVGQWFGPNTIAQVLKKISVYDSWSDIVIHIALDNVVIQEDIRKQCRKSSQGSRENKDARETEMLPDGEQFSTFVNDTSNAQGHDLTRVKAAWKPLFLIIPLRLGLTEINPIYFDALKKSLALHQSVGVIGGKPNHAHWFIGYVGQELIYLDPHTTQPIVDLRDPTNDSSYHCPTPPSRMSFSRLDPSIALGFYCADEKDFDELCENFESINDRSMFEVRKTAPVMWPYDESRRTSSTAGRKKKNSLSDFQAANGSSMEDDDDDEFEII